MLNNLHLKGLTPPNLLTTLMRLSSHRMCNACRLGRCGILMLLAASTALGHADTVYRCGDAYSASEQCAHGPATQVNPSAELRTTGPSQASTAVHELREAQALEKQRLYAERTAAQAARQQLLSKSSAQPNSANTLVADTQKRQAKKAHKVHSAYFTAVDPTASSKKKSTAKAVPEKLTSQP